MDAFLDLYFTIDKERKGSIRLPELRKYMEENDIDRSFYERWKNLFDPENTGEISLEYFCQTLGLSLDEIKVKYDPIGNEMDGVEVIESDMDDKIKHTICGLIDKGLLIYENRDQDLGKYLKEELERYFGPLWHVIIVYGRYYSYYSYIKGNSFCFKKKNRIFIVFKTPL